MQARRTHEAFPPLINSPDSHRTARTSACRQHNTSTINLGAFPGPLGTLVTDLAECGEAPGFATDDRWVGDCSDWVRVVWFLEGWGNGYAGGIAL